MLLKDIDSKIVLESHLLKEFNDPDYDVVDMTPDLHDILLEYLTCNYPIPEKMWDPQILRSIDFFMLPTSKLLNDYRIFGSSKKLKLLTDFGIVYGKIDFTLFDLPDNCWSKAAAQFGNLDCLKYLHENGCPWNVWTCVSAASRGNLDCLKYLHENNCPWNEYAPAYAAANNHFDCLQYICENNCPLDEYTCYYSAAAGNLEMLKYVRSKGCPWKSEIFGHVKEKHSSEFFKYLCENNCPVKKKHIN